jgi:hypothetical protein
LITSVTGCTIALSTNSLWNKVKEACGLLQMKNIAKIKTYFIIKIRKNNLKNSEEDVKQESFTKIKICGTQTATQTAQKPCI